MDGDIKKTAVLLVMREVDAEFFAQQLKPHAPDTYFVHIPNLEELEKLSSRDNLDMRLISFCSPIIVPERILKQLNWNCLNFHPGPPERPGFMPAPFAIHEKAKDFGATFHYMLGKVDTGAIIEAARFPLDGSEDVAAIEIQAYKALLAMVMQRAKELADVGFKLVPSGDQWSGVKTTRKDLEAIQGEVDFEMPALPG